MLSSNRITCHLLWLCPLLSIATEVTLHMLLYMCTVRTCDFCLVFRCCSHCNQVSRLEAEKLELTGSLCSMQQKLTEIETFAQELEEERVTRLHYCLPSFWRHIHLRNSWNYQRVLCRNITACCCSSGQGYSLLWTHALRPFINRLIALAQGWEEFG